jgi:3-oxoacyl-[acyl-carrier-protein] synthase III
VAHIHGQARADELKLAFRQHRDRHRVGVTSRNVKDLIALLLQGERAMDKLTKRAQPDRSKINIGEVRYWTKALGVDRQTLQKAVDKVGNSAAAAIPYPERLGNHSIVKVPA